MGCSHLLRDRNIHCWQIWDSLYFGELICQQTFRRLEIMLANFFEKVREIIEAAETPFAKMAIFLLPILAPVVPATFTGLHIFKLLVEIFPNIPVSILITLAFVVGLVLEMLGYVGAIEFIHSIFRLVRGKSEKNWLTVGLTGIAYVFYLFSMFLINVQLSKYFQTPPIVTSIVGLLSFVTVPTGLLAANYLGSKDEDELDYRLRQEKRADSLERYKIKHGILPTASQTYQKDTGNFPTQEETFQQLSSNWRKVSSNLPNELVIFIAQSEPKDIIPELTKYGIVLTPRSASNWRGYAQDEAKNRGLLQ